MEQRRQSTRQLVRRVSFLAAAFAVTAGLAVQGQMEAAAYRRYLANGATWPTAGSTPSPSSRPT